MLDISWPTEMSCASYKQWMDWLFMNSSSDLCRKIIYAIWVIWSDRNKQVHERKIKQNIDMVRFIVSYLKELEAIKSRLSARCVQQERWRPPEQTFVKIHFDASFQGNLLLLRGKRLHASKEFKWAWILTSKGSFWKGIVSLW